MRISDWSSDVCSSDLVALQAASRRPGLVRAMVLIEPSGFLKPEQLPAMRDTACLFVYGDNLGATPLWRSLMRQAADFRQGSIGRVSCRARVCHDGSIAVVPVHLKKQIKVQRDI